STSPPICATGFPARPSAKAASASTSTSTRRVSSDRLEGAVWRAHAVGATNAVRQRPNHGEEAMQQIAITFAALLIGTVAAQGQAPSWTVPPESQRCPSKWGAGDERGSGNHMKPQTVLNAVKLI